MRRVRFSTSELMAAVTLGAVLGEGLRAWLSNDVPGVSLLVLGAVLLVGLLLGFGLGGNMTGRLLASTIFWFLFVKACASPAYRAGWDTYSGWMCLIYGWLSGT